MNYEKLKQKYGKHCINFFIVIEKSYQQVSYIILVRKMIEQEQPFNLQNQEKYTSKSSGREDNDLRSPDRKKIKRKKTINCTMIANLAQTKYVVVRKVIKNHFGMKVIKDATSIEWDIYWTDNAVTPEQLAKMKPYQKINHFPGMFSLSRKNNLARNLVKMEKKFPNEYNFFPKTWVLPSQLNELRNFMETQSHPVVIAKPEASSQGKGIFLSKNIDDFDFGEHYVVQKYLKRPFILDGLKFDLRVYVLVAGCDPLRLYIYKEGLARFATEQYVIPKKENLSNLYMHLTNYAINKQNEKFQFNNSKNEMDRGHKRSLSSVLSRIEELGEDKDKLWNDIKDKIAKTMISAQPLLSHHYRSCQPENYANNMCFEVLGFDVILDQHLKPEILEVNYTPSFTTDTPLDKFIKENLIKESLTLMNLTTRAKSDVIAVKKKQMLERTLTGKRVWHTKQSRQALVKKYQDYRNTWEDKHIGNFERILPTNNEEITKRYEEYLAFSQECYLMNTGANIRRNQKVTGNSSSNFQGQPLKQSQNKLTTTQKLEKIYRSKLKPMTLGKKKKSETSKVQPQESSSNKMVSSKSTVKPPSNAGYFEPGLGQTRNQRTAFSIKKGISTVYNITFNDRGRQ